MYRGIVERKAIMKPITPKKTGFLKKVGILVLANVCGFLTFAFIHLMAEAYLPLAMAGALLGQEQTPFDKFVIAVVAGSPLPGMAWNVVSMTVIFCNRKALLS